MITRLAIARREPFADSHEFPVTGPYEKIVGKLYGDVDPEHRLNRVIVDLDKAPRNRRGVPYESDFFILKPLDIDRGNGKILFDAPNRGAKRILAFLNDAPQSNDPSTREQAGNGFLMEAGYTIVWCGWQGDLLPGENWLTLKVPVATAGGKELVNRIRSEIVVDVPGVKSQPLSGDHRVASYEAATLEKSAALLTVREKSYGVRRVVDPADWEFATCTRDPDTGRTTVQPRPTHLYLPEGFLPGHIYEFIYPAKNPLVLGLGFAATRDFVSFLRFRKEARGTPNPLLTDDGRGAIRAAYAWGRSQSGRYLRDFVYHGFNQDEAGRKVFDAIAPHVAGGGRVYLNYRFARPVSSSQQHTNQLDPELFPHAYNVIRDAQSGRRDGILKRPKTDPLVFHTQTSTEYWQKRGCLAHTDGKGKDLRLPATVRLYVIASAQHNSPFGAESVKERTQLRINPLPAGDILRALLVALDQWATHGLAPPPSRYPTVNAGTLVPPRPARGGFPKIPGVNFAALHNRQLFLNYGDGVLRGRISVHPPEPIGDRGYTILVPKVDRDGNDIGGIRLPAIEAPLGTHTGWNLRPAGLAEGELAGLLGSFIPFSVTKAERLKSGDPRLSLEERYKDKNDYVSRVSRAARLLIEQRYLLPADADRLIAEAGQRFSILCVGFSNKPLGRFEGAA
jgi:hypothetical protein